MDYNSYQIAEIIGVNVSTIKRWTDSGKLNCEQTIGGHRKFHLNHLADFIKNYSKSNIDLNIGYLIGKNSKLIEAINNNDLNTIINYSYRNLIQGKTENFLSLYNALILKNYTIHSIFDDLLIPILHKMGEQWGKGKLSITEEHLASEIIRRFLSNLVYGHISKKKSLNAFCFTLINDNHDLPLYMAEAILNQNQNIKTFNLGPNLPIHDFILLSQKINPDIIFISTIFIDNIKLINKEIKTLCKYFSKNKIPIVIKGAGINQLKITEEYISINSFEELQMNIINITNK